MDSDHEWIAADDNPPDLPPFTADLGLQNLSNVPMDCSDICTCFLVKILLSYLRKQTCCRYAAQFIQSQDHVKANNRVNDWKLTTVAELK